MIPSIWPFAAAWTTFGGTISWKTLATSPGPRCSAILAISSLDALSASMPAAGLPST